MASGAASQTHKHPDAELLQDTAGSFDARGLALDHSLSIVPEPGPSDLFNSSSKLSSSRGFEGGVLVYSLRSWQVLATYSEPFQ